MSKSKNQKTHKDSGLEVDFSQFKVDFDLDFDRIASQQSAPKSKKPVGEEIGVGTRQRIVTKATRRRFYDLSNVKNAVALIESLPAVGETVHCLMGGDFHAWDLVPAAHRLLGRSIDVLHITTLGFNHGNNGHLCEMLDVGDVKTVFLVCSTYLEGADPDVFNTAKKRLTERGQRIIATRNHAKIILIAPAGSVDRYTFEMSANLRSCNNVEQVTLTNDVQLYEFHRRWIERFFK